MPIAKIKALTVISRTSVMHYKKTTKPLRQIAQELGVQALVEGSAMRAGNRVRITAQLVQADNGVSLWTDSYDRRKDPRDDRRDQPGVGADPRRDPEGEGEREIVKPLFSIPEILEAVKEVGKRGLTIKRFKGLGEMNAQQLKETTLDPRTRTLLSVSIDSLVEADQTFAQLLGKDASERYRIIMDEANLVDDLDL